ncbi:hypothetical protein [Okeania sp. KiyG1]|uniref:hypothetical protein n=1 Tax=Okeania sp. KiyG1 TaxID=2720165 RepID=UPI0019213630|nr:hypothetical protein [Okeania sp. KiyG1]GGA38970.1 hypothetical protein CYANOKiyG1_57190 [Okeania sp. KiyG1]
MKRKVRVGGSFPSSVPYASIRIELEQEVPADDSWHKTANELKLEAAKLASGSDKVELEKCLKVLNYPDKYDKILELRTLSDVYQYEIAILKEKMKKNFPRLAELKKLIGDYEAILEISDRHNISDEFWDDIKGAINDQEQQKQGENDELASSMMKAVFDAAVYDTVEPF